MTANRVTFQDRKDVAIVKCTKLAHTHTTTDDGNGGEFPEAVAMWCHFCGAAAHYDRGTEMYHHDSADDCWQMGRDSAESACVVAS